jgi:hypothetical protein
LTRPEEKIILCRSRPFQEAAQTGKISKRSMTNAGIGMEHMAQPELRVEEIATRAKRKRTFTR